MIAAKMPRQLSPSQARPGTVVGRPRGAGGGIDCLAEIRRASKRLGLVSETPMRFAIRRLRPVRIQHVGDQRALLVRRLE
jgi:hypothetical protein